MVYLTVNLTPALTGVIGEIWYQAAGNWYKAIDVPASVDGVIEISYTDSIPGYPHKIVFPEQAVGGVIYLQAETPVFDLLSGDQTFYVTLTPAAEPPVVTSVSIDAQASAEAGVPFSVLGYVSDQYGAPMGGVPVYLYDNGSHFATPTTGSDGYYLQNTSISLPGVHELAARADSVWAYRDITITDPASPPGDVMIKIVTTEADPYARYHGKTVDESLDPSFWDTQPDKIIATTGAGFTHTQTVELAEGSHYVIYGNSASAGYPWHTKIFANDTLIAEGDVVRGSHLRGDFTVGAVPPVGIHTTTTISIPDKVGVNEKFNISGILYETESGIAIPNQPINHSYNGKSLGTSITGVDGDYLKEVSIPESGVWTLKSEFPGTETLQASKSQANAVVAATPLVTTLLIAGSIATGIALSIYGLS